MNFALTEEQVALKDAVKDFFATKSTPEVVRNAMENTGGFDSSLFQAVCSDLGLASLIVEEQYGGFGASDLELNIAIEQHGYYLAPTPLRVQSYATILLQECGSDEAKEHILPKIITGDEIATVALDGFDRVAFSNIAKHLIYVEDNKLFHVDINDDVEIVELISVDPTQPIGRINFNKSKAELLSDSEISEQIKIAKARMTVLLANEMLGATTHAFDMALEYAKEREQFGKAIGSFQAIKHLLADMYVDIEKAKSLCLYAAYLSSIRDDELIVTASMAKSFVTELFNHVTRENIQIHGGIGFTYEHDAHLYLKRAAFNSFELGGTSEHNELIAESILG